MSLSASRASEPGAIAGTALQFTGTPTFSLHQLKHLPHKEPGSAAQSTKALASRAGSVTRPQGWNAIDQQSGACTHWRAKHLAARPTGLAARARGIARMDEWDAIAEAIRPLRQHELLLRTCYRTCAPRRRQPVPSELPRFCLTVADSQPTIPLIGQSKGCAQAFPPCIKSRFVEDCHDTTDRRLG